MMLDDTIAAISSGPAQAAISLIRISGTQSMPILQKIFSTKKNVKELEAQRIYFGTIIDKNQHVLDEVLVSIFFSPHSYTGQDMVEISCHGSPYIQQKILEHIFSYNCRPAEPGEFTMRAYLNGKIDLAQAEAVADLIASENKMSHQIAFSQMRGGISNELHILRDELITFTALIELELDFSDEDVEFADRNKLESLISKILDRTQQLKNSFEYGNAIKNGIPIVIAGKPNAGKSTLLNSILQEERAIVSNIAGTTRDTIEEAITIQGIQLRFTDTAGIRETRDIIENLGIEKARQKMEQAQYVLYLFDMQDTTPEDLRNELSKIPTDKTLMIIPTKTDLYPGQDWLPWIQEAQSAYPGSIYLSDFNIVDQTKVDYILHAITEKITSGVDPQGLIITNARHYEALKQTETALLEVQEGLKNQLSGDLLSFHLREALSHIGDITGEIEVDRDILGTIFSKFCIGK